jgi:two-component system OmpR family sensor kinase
MPVGRLFWKFFLAIWGALLTAGLGAGVAVNLLRPAPPVEQAIDAGPRAVFIVSTAASVLEHGGQAALNTLMGDWDRSLLHEPNLYVVDENGVDLSGRAVPAAAYADAQHWLERMAPRDAEGPQQEPAPGASNAVRLVHTPDGKQLMLFMPADPGHHEGGMPPEALTGRVPPPPGMPGPGGPRDHGSPFPWLPIAMGLLASIGFSALLAWHFAKPVRHLRWAFDAVAAGNLDARVMPRMGGRRDEIADLGRNFDGMVHQLSQLLEAQRRLLHDVSHELRSPLARLQLAIDLARQDPEKIRTSFQRVELEAGRLDQLVGELLTLSRLESGTPDGGKTTVDIVELVAGIADDAQFEAEANGRALQFRGNGSVMVDVDVELVMRAVENVVRNAVKYTMPGTMVEVDVALSDSGDKVLIDVSDRGPGVPSANLASIFQPFYRCDNTGGSAGFGLGLAIAKRAVEAHGGMVLATNRPDGGLKVVLSLPALFPAAPAQN